MTWNWKYTTNIIVLFYEKLLEKQRKVLQWIIANSENKVKITWKIIKNLTRTIQNSQHVSPTLKVDGIEQSPKQAAEAFNNYSLNIRENLN
jgi:hypothetical protein